MSFEFLCRLYVDCKREVDEEFAPGAAEICDSQMLRKRRVQRKVGFEEKVTIMQQDCDDFC